GAGADPTDPSGRMSPRADERTPAWWTARALGVCCGPTLMPFALLAVVAARGGTPPPGAAAVFILFTSAVPLGLVVAAHAAGLVHDLRVARHEDRALLVWLGALSGAVGAGVLAWLGADRRLVALAAAVASQATVLAGLTAHEKVSYHSGGTAGVAVAGWLLLGGA